MIAELQLRPPAELNLPPVPWRDPHTVSPAKLAEYIDMLVRECEQNPRSADLRTCLGMAHAMNYDVYRSQDALEEALSIEPRNFFAQLKYAELLYRIRALIRAEGETLKALDCARNSWELALARKQLQEIRTLMRSGTQKPEWSKSLKMPGLCLMAMVLVFSIMMVWR